MTISVNQEKIMGTLSMNAHQDVNTLQTGVNLSKQLMGWTAASISSLEKIIVQH